MKRQRIRDLGHKPGDLETGKHNAITDVEGVGVGHVTVIEGDDIRTGVTAITPHSGNLYKDTVPAAVDVLNGYGKTVGLSQVLFEGRARDRRSAGPAQLRKKGGPDHPRGSCR